MNPFQSRLDSVLAEGYSIHRFSDLALPFQKAIVWFMAVDGDAWDRVELPSTGDAEAFKSALWELLPQFVEHYGGIQFGKACLAKAALVESVMSDEEIAHFHACWDDYHSWYIRRCEIPNHPEAGRWPVILSSDPSETIRDGWHRFHSYMRDGAAEIPAVFFPKAHHLSAHRLMSSTVQD